MSAGGAGARSAVGFAGVLIALQPSVQTITWPALIALCGSLAFAGLMLVTRSLRATPDVVLASTQFACTLLFGAALAPIGWVAPSLRDLGLFALAGAVSVMALLCVNRSLKLAPASVVVPYQYTMIVWAVLFGYVVFGDLPSLATLIGAAIIVAAGLYIFLRERTLGHEPPADAAGGVRRANRRTEHFAHLWDTRWCARSVVRT